MPKQRKIENSKPSRSSKKAKHNLYLRKIQALVFCGVLLMVVSSGWMSHEARKLSFAQDVAVVDNSELAEPTFIHIPETSIALPIEQTAINKGVWQISKNGASHLSNSAVPGNNGNIIVYAHNTSDRFGNIVKMHRGDEIVLTTQDGKIHTYFVEKTLVTTPKDVRVLKSNGSEMLTIYTCTGFADSKRFVVQATKI